MKGQGWITGKHGPMELGQKILNLLRYWGEYLKAGLYGELRLVGHYGSGVGVGSGPGQVKRLGARS